MGACELGPGDEVITVSHTAPATAFAIELSGATPVFVDVDPATYTMDPERAAEAIGPRTRGLVPVHLYGQCADMDPLRRLAEEHGLWLVEDAAQAHGARYGGARAGTVGQLGCFSFYPTKNLGALGDGGAVVTDDGAIAERVRLLRAQGLNSRLDEIQAAVLRARLPRVEPENERRRTIARIYDEAFRGTAARPLAALPDRRHARHLYVAVVSDREGFRRAMSDRGVATLVHYPKPVHGHAPYAELATGSAGLARSEWLAERVVSLPIHPGLRDEEVAYVAEVSREAAAG
jgi:dTDP-4-amino-4,6-dideoxygalactose transaminase